MTDKEQAEIRFMEIFNKTFVNRICNFDMLTDEDRKELKELMKQTIKLGE